MNPAHERILRYFEHGHLPEGLMRDTSARFSELAHAIVADPCNDAAERTVALRKLMEAKDAAVRAVLPQ